MIRAYSISATTATKLAARSTASSIAAQREVGEFQSAIGVTTGSYARFMKPNGPQSGYGSVTYDPAAMLFKKRKLQGIKMPKKGVKKAEEDKKMDVSDFYLDGEDTESVEVYDTCDEVRKNIAAYLREEGRHIDWIPP